MSFLVASILSIVHHWLVLLHIIFVSGLKGQSNRRLISLSEVKQHQSEGSMWTVLKGHVYNISPYMKFHPGGSY